FDGAVPIPNGVTGDGQPIANGFIRAGQLWTQECRSKIMVGTAIPHLVRRYGIPLVLVVILVAGSSGGDAPRPPVKVTITNSKEEASEDFAPIDPTQRVTFQQRAMTLQVSETDQRNLALRHSHLPMFLIDGRLIRGAIGKGDVKQVGEPLPTAA